MAIKQLGEINGWSAEQLVAIINKAKAVWGKISSNWDKVDVSELGNALSKWFTQD